LLAFNQWWRLRPFYLPTGGILFLVIAAPWHVLAAMRNVEWTWFYFVYEQWERFFTTEHGRYQPWWYFIPIVLLGFFPWTGFLWAALRDRLRGGWAAREKNANAWYFVTWAAVVFLFFSKAQSKLIPYILPAFPPLAVLVGGWLGGIISEGRKTSAGHSLAVRLRVGLSIYGFLAGVLGLGMLVAVYKPGIISDAAQMDALRGNAIWGAAALFTGGILAPWLARVRGARAALLAMALSTGVLYLSLAKAQDEIARPGTKELALLVKARAQPGDRVYHYHEFFHDFLFYGEREVGTVAYGSELELQIDPVARASGRFIDEPEFRQQWSGPVRVWIVARKKDVVELMADPTFHYHLLGESPAHYLFSNQP
jgi:4-amino-4-deoxy-L-arabinose transferase-like glycosyltransferase